MNYANHPNSIFTILRDLKNAKKVIIFVDPHEQNLTNLSTILLFLHFIVKTNDIYNNAPAIHKPLNSSNTT